jgi:hypothetical protein
MPNVHGAGILIAERNSNHPLADQRCGSMLSTFFTSARQSFFHCRVRPE